MQPIPPLMAIAGALAVLATGYSWGTASSSEVPNPFINTRVVQTSDVRFVTGSDAEPPPWPADAPKAPPPRQVTASARPAASVVPASVILPVAAPAGARRVIPAAVPMLATNPPMLDVARVPRPSREVTFGRTLSGEPVAILWND